ncbi:unnamed protein product [Gadus morhua 'NCC']
MRNEFARNAVVPSVCLLSFPSPTLHPYLWISRGRGQVNPFLGKVRKEAGGAKTTTEAETLLWAIGAVGKPSHLCQVDKPSAPPAHSRG